MNIKRWVMQMKMLTRGDKILIFLILIINTLPLLIPVIAQDSQGTKTIVINVDGNIIDTFKLEDSKDTQYIDFEFMHENRTYSGKLETKDGRVRLLRLPKEITPQAIHSDMGWIDRPSQMIVALPVKLIITVEGSSEDESDVDITAY